MLRYFRATDAVVEQVRSALNTAWGYPNAETRTETAIDPAASLPHDAQGLAYLVISAEFCAYHPAATMLADALASGAVQEVAAADYAALFPVPG